MECDQERELATHAYPLHVPFHASCTCLQLHTRITQWLSWHTHTHSIMNGSLDDKFENWRRWNDYKSTCQKSNNSTNISVNSFPQSGVEGVKHKIYSVQYTHYPTQLETFEHSWVVMQNWHKWDSFTAANWKHASPHTTKCHRYICTYTRTYVCPIFMLSTVRDSCTEEQLMSMTGGHDWWRALISFITGILGLTQWYCYHLTTNIIMYKC